MPDQKTVLGYLDKYQKQRVEHVIQLPGREKPFVGARTNNLAEHRFGAIKQEARQTLALGPSHPCGTPRADNGSPDAHHEMPTTKNQIRNPGLLEGIKQTISKIVETISGKSHAA